MLYWCNFPHAYSKKYLIVFKSILSLKKKIIWKGGFQPSEPLPPPGSANEFRYHRCCSCERYNPQHLVLTLNDTCVCVSQRHLVAMIKGVNRCHKLGRFSLFVYFSTTYNLPRRNFWFSLWARGNSSNNIFNYLKVFRKCTDNHWKQLQLNKFELSLSVSGVYRV